MREFHIKQNLFSLSGKFAMKDSLENEVYYVEGSFLQIPKTFTLLDPERNVIALITKKTFSFLPTFFVEVNGKEVVTIKKEFTFFKARYSIDTEGIEVEGNWWDMDFKVLQHGETIGTVNKEWFTWGDSYKVEVYQEDLEAVVIALVIAIDCVKADQSGRASASASF